MDADRPLAPAPDVVSTKLDDDEAVLLHLKTKQYFSLNETGTRIWELLEGGARPPAILAALEAEYEGDPDDMRRLVTAFLDDLKQQGLVHEGA